MALWGPIQVNDQVIGMWSARRTVRDGYYDPESYVRYECEVRINDQHWQGDILHVPADGALILMQRVIRQADRQLWRKRTAGPRCPTCGIIPAVFSDDLPSATVDQSAHSPHE